MEVLIEAVAIRARVRAFVVDHPGTTLGQVCRALDLSWGRGFHHVAQLQREGSLQRVQAGRRVVLVPAGRDMDEARLRADALLRGATARAVAQAVVDHAPTNVQTLTRMIGQSERVIYYHIKQLLAAGLVRSASHTRHFGLEPTATLMLLLGER